MHTVHPHLAPKLALSGTFPVSVCCYLGQRLGTSTKMIVLPRSATLKHFLVLGELTQNQVNKNGWQELYPPSPQGHRDHLETAK